MILIIDCGSTKVPQIEAAVSPSYNFETVKIIDLPSKTIASYTGAIISGAPILLSQVDQTPYLQATRILFKSNIPILGICFGHQIMALQHNADVLMGNPIRSNQEIQLLKNHALFEGLSGTFEMNQDHCEYATIPHGFEHLATSNLCINEAMANDTLNQFGVQFHPETSKRYGQILIDNFLNICSNTQTSSLV